jgi:hypothetical protein
LVRSLFLIVSLLLSRGFPSCFATILTVSDATSNGTCLGSSSNGVLVLALVLIRSLFAHGTGRRASRRAAHPLTGCGPACRGCRLGWVIAGLRGSLSFAGRPIRAHLL